MSKAALALPDDASEPKLFAFTAPDGTTHTATQPVSAVVTPGLLRRNRGDELGFAFAVLEDLLDEAGLAAIDGSWEALRAVTQQLQPHIEEVLRLTMGES